MRDELRNELVPLNRKYPIQQLLQAFTATYPGSSTAAHHLRTVMLKGVNNSMRDDAKLLVKLLRASRRRSI